MNDYMRYVLLQNTFEFKKDDGKSVKEDVSVNTQENYVQYHLKDEDSEIWVIDDFNRVSRLGLVSQKRFSLFNYSCYLTH